MEKLYTKEVNTTKNILPKKETVDFILNYSKALKVVKINDENIEIISN